MPRKVFEREVKPLIESAKKMEDARVEIKSQEQAIKRLERHIEILQKELAALKKDVEELTLIDAGSVWGAQGVDRVRGSPTWAGQFRAERDGAGVTGQGARL